MNRIDRLLAMVLVLQRHKLVRAEDLAARFEISKRTVYRDVAALSEMGVPVVAQPGEGYSLMEGYFLPPLVFTPDEAAALFLGAKWLATQATGKLPNSTAGALTKLAHVLPARTFQEVQHFTDVLHFFVTKKPVDLDDPTLADIQRAIRERLWSMKCRICKGSNPGSLAGAPPSRCWNRKRCAPLYAPKPKSSLRC